MDSIIDEFTVRDCDVASFSLWDAKAKKVNIVNSKFGVVQNEGLLASEFILHNVTFLVETDFNRSQADATELFKVIFAPTATLDATGSNIPFQQ